MDLVGQQLPIDTHADKLKLAIAASEYLLSRGKLPPAEWTVLNQVSETWVRYRLGLIIGGLEHHPVRM